MNLYTKTWNKKQLDYLTSEKTYVMVEDSFILVFVLELKHNINVKHGVNNQTIDIDISVICVRNELFN